MLLALQNIGEDMPNTSASNFWNETLSPLLRHCFTSLGTIALCVTLIWTVAQPHAEDFIKRTVNTEQFATRLSLDELQRRVSEVLVNQSESVKTQERLKTDIEIIKELQREQRKDIKDLLRSIRN